MRLPRILTIFICGIALTYAVAPVWATSPSISDPDKSQETIYMAVEKAAQFPGGDAAMFKFINENIQYPEDALEECIQGSVMVKFVVEKDGSLSNITIARGLTESLDKEAIRVISSMPKWSPAEMSGTPVRSYVTTKVNFKLPE